MWIPTVVSTFLNHVSLNFLYFGTFRLWGQFVFLGVDFTTHPTGLAKTPRLEDRIADEENVKDDEDKSFLANASRHFPRGHAQGNGRAT